MKSQRCYFIITLIAANLLLMGTLQNSQACSRVVHISQDGSHVVTGRNMDWFEDVDTNLWLFPSGMKRAGAATLHFSLSDETGDSGIFAGSTEQ
jgi:choloylglycine hydrolase